MGQRRRIRELLDSAIFTNERHVTAFVDAVQEHGPREAIRWGGQRAMVADAMLVPLRAWRSQVADPDESPDLALLTSSWEAYARQRLSVVASRADAPMHERCEAEGWARLLDDVSGLIMGVVAEATP